MLYISYDRSDLFLYLKAFIEMETLPDENLVQDSNMYKNNRPRRGRNNVVSTAEDAMTAVGEEI